MAAKLSRFYMHSGVRESKGFVEKNPKYRMGPLPKMEDTKPTEKRKGVDLSKFYNHGGVRETHGFVEKNPKYRMGLVSTDALWYGPIYR